jgi:hypothetical protein
MSKSNENTILLQYVGELSVYVILTKQWMEAKDEDMKEREKKKRLATEFQQVFVSL